MSHPLKTMSFNNYFDHLNDIQRQAVEVSDAHLLVLAGAGTGKTRVLTSRVSYLVQSEQAKPSEIIAMTFTNKAANEMRERILNILGPQAQEIWLGTFHSLSARILRRHAELVDLSQDFLIIDTDDQLKIIKQLLEAENVDIKKYPPKVFLSRIDRQKNDGLLPDKNAKMSYSHNVVEALFPKIYLDYQNRLKMLNAVDFGDLLLYCIDIFNRFPDIARLYHGQFKHILVDEYQDTNIAQYLWLRLLAQGGAFVCCVGDDDQSIYGWRGAKVDNILRFEHDFPNAVVVRLEQNYRSTPHILGAASGLIQHNTGRLGKTLWTSESKGEKVIVKGVWDGDDEARYVGQEIERLYRAGNPYSSMAILVRALFQTRSFEDRFTKIGIPFRIVGGTRFYERMEIRDAIAYLRLIANPNDSLAFERVVNLPKRGIGPAVLNVLHQYGHMQQVSLYQAAQVLCDSDEIKGASRAGLKSFLKDTQRWIDMSISQTPAEVLKIVLDESGYTGMWMSAKTPDAPGRLENLDELARAIQDYETIHAYLEHISLVTDINQNAQGDMVSLMSVHGAKGLEFDTVFLTGWEEGLFPHPRSMDESGSVGEEEERRLAYVGITRARKRVFITHASARTVHGKRSNHVTPSRFLKQIPHQHCLFINSNGLKVERVVMHDDDYFHDDFNQEFEMMGGKEYTFNSPYHIGQSVRHMKFGLGKVTRVEGDKLTVQFDTSGTKSVVACFLEILD